MPNQTAQEVSAVLRRMADPAVAEHSQRYFKTAKGQYGCGDRFLGIRVPALRSQIGPYAQLPRPQILKLLRSAYHEERLFALLLLVRQFERGDDSAKEAVYSLYLKHIKWVNNWDLVDLSAPNIVGAFLLDRDKQPLYDLAAAPILWPRRIAALATLTFIRNNRFDDALAIAWRLIHDPEDLIHKAVGWMLREIGKRRLAAEKTFLDAHAAEMPRTMLRYAIEKFPPDRRQRYMKK